MVTLLSAFLSLFFLMSGEIVILCTCGSPEEAEKVARHLLEKRVAGCVSMVPGVRSFYWWQGAVESASEHLLLIKSSAELFAEVERAIREVHSYEVPEVLALPVLEGAADYLKWLRSNLRKFE